MKTTIQKAALRGATSLTAFALLCGTAYAQETTPADSDAGETIIVTGSRIARPELEGSVPVAVVSQERIQATGASNIQDVLADLPSVGQNVSRTSSNFSTTGNGVATVNLRNLGSVRTLVLVNGRRFAPGIPGTSTVDLNTIPTDLIKQVDVVTGGASAVYGSEAIAGVVNFVLDDKFEGLRAHAQGNISDEGDAPRQMISLTAGKAFADDRGHIVVNGQYDRDAGLRSRNRSFSAVDNPNRSSFASQGLFSIDGSFAPGANTYTFDANNNLKQYQSANIDGYNRNADRYLGLPVERYLGTALGSFEFSDALNLFGEFTYVKSKSRSSLEPQAVADTDLAYADGSPYAGIPITNPYIPTAIRDAMIAAGTDTLSFRRRSNDIFDRSNRNDRDMWRGVIGAKGTFADKFNYEVYYAHSDMKDRTSSGTIYGPNYANALNAVAGPNGPVCSINVDADLTNNDAACVPINIFGFNTVSPEAAAYVTNNGQQSTYLARMKQDIVSANISGELFSIGSASPIAFAFGGEYRREKSSEDFDEATNLGLTLGNMLSDTRGKYNVKEVYGEVSVPILEDRPFFHYLGLEGAARYADYSTVGGVWSWKAGAEWAPVRDIRFRGVYAEATRAPNISELFSAQSETFPAVIDPCDQGAGDGDSSGAPIPSGSLPAACLANPAIAAAAAGGNFVYSTAQIQNINGFVGGNPNLREETAKTLTLGAVFTPTFAPGFSLSVDYYRIKVKNAIGIIGQQTSLDECVTGSGAALFCDNITRDSRGYVTQIDAINLNTGSFEVEGLDIQGRYRAEVAQDTVIDLSVFWNHLLTQQQTSFPGGPTQKELGQLDCYSCGRLGSGFRDKVNASATIDWRNFKLNWRVNYLSSVVDDLTKAEPIKTGSFWYHDAQIRLGIDEDKKFELYFGMDNIFDKKPPVFNDTNVVTFPGTQTSANTYDLYGRMLYAGVDVRF
ncbi:TonB-dependent receptor plug domain-containing protein [Novosphingobium sp. BL-52-GroH]|uniref:TonB-dependent receptor plug domain-containing protein n=1 Tax=Novosphingobium sp. BL-52-GroH TaxID=3349877 RepID=UPI00384E813C